LENRTGIVMQVAKLDTTATGRPGAGRRIRGLDADQRRAQRRDQLLDAALELFAAQGYQNTSIEQICVAAYVGTKSFYEVFDSREGCYLALLQRISNQAFAIMMATLDEAPDREEEATPVLIGAFAHALVDDRRVAKVTFGEGGAISPASERQRRANRRWAASFIEAIWQRYGHTDDGSAHDVAIGLIGGLFDILADWQIDADPGDPTAVHVLVAKLIRFYDTVQAGLGYVPVPASPPRI